MNSAITPSRFMLEGKEYVKHDNNAHPSPCLSCDFVETHLCYSPARPPCAREFNQGTAVYFKLAEKP